MYFSIKALKETTLKHQQENKEIEVKFLLSRLPDILQNYFEIKQGYLDINSEFVRGVISLYFFNKFKLAFEDLNNIEVARIREKINNNDSDIKKYSFTLKGPGLLERDEYEIEIEPKLFNILWEKTINGYLLKNRFERFIKVNGRQLVIEFDEYKDNLIGLYTVEIELNPNNLYLRPYLEKMLKNVYQLADNEIKDVTEDPYYKNNNLARVNMNGLQN